MNTPPVSVILLAGGKGLRMGTATPKQYLLLDSKPIALHSLEVFFASPSISEVVVVCDPSFHSIFSAYPVKFALPGERRQDSVCNGFRAISPTSFWICIHDAARPFITSPMIEQLFQEGKKFGSATLGIPLKFTVKQAKEDLFVEKTLSRDCIWEIQTPQFLHREVLEKGIAFAAEKQLTVTDDVSFAELIGHPTKLVEGSPINLKITTPEDLAIAEHFKSTSKRLLESK